MKEGVHFAMQVVTIDSMDEKISHIGSRVMAMERSKCKLFCFELPAVWSVRLCIDVMSCDREEWITRV